MNAKHTPGPWSCKFFHGTPEDLEQMKKFGMKPVLALTNDGSRYVMAESGRVALVDCQTEYKRGKGHETECATRDANALLIAAAPDLLAALGNALRSMEYAAMALEAPEKCALRENIEQAKEALKKAGIEQ